MTYILIFLIFTYVTQMPNLNVQGKILHAETNLCGGNSIICFHHYNTQRSNYNHHPEISIVIHNYKVNVK